MSNTQILDDVMIETLDDLIDHEMTVSELIEDEFSY